MRPTNRPRDGAPLGGGPFSSVRAVRDRNPFHDDCAKVKIGSTLIVREVDMDFCWVTINVKDMSKSLKFYQEIIGLKVERKMKPNPEFEIVFLGSGKTEIELIYNSKNTESGYGKDISLGFIVDSVDHEMEKLKRNKITIQSGPFQPNPHIKFFYILDPNGVTIQLVENIK
jgi:lactoylglutathione lyase